MEEFVENVKSVGLSMISQTMNLAPADKKIYALRDSISCVENIPLIASSIMSKKIASGANKIVIDVTIGSGAFMPNLEEGRKLANQMIEIGKLANRETVCVLTNMDEPLGYAVGNNLEVIEAIKFLRGDMPEDLKQVVIALANYMIKLSGKSQDDETNKQMILENIRNGSAYKKLIEMVNNQGGDISFIQDETRFEKAKYIENIVATKDGYIQKINAKEVGEIAKDLGAGRIKKDDKIDNTVGIVMSAKVGDKIKVGQTLATIHSNDEEKLQEAKRDIEQTIIIGEKPKEKIPTILEIIS